ncbi:hypothetical protein RclHR1_37040001 [Rhizophagus clarus]|uniref:Uncharacterized protein n=1 Tax=Rhizophagus clarus TaxID=94130 RepID=A0A2Z6RTW6_9GLOM|nr:hypothetical protein RclHR1_37040001 [Rhizophagus clarus]GES82898.1 hypothetical protein RCL_jg192.t1 [Rhizophagus clarus]
MVGFILALSHHLLKHSWRYIQVCNGEGESDDSEDGSSKDEPNFPISGSSTAANKSKLVVTPKASEEEMDISFTEEDQSASQLHITNDDRPNMDSSMTNDKKKRNKKNSSQNQSQKTNQVNQPILSSSSPDPTVLKKLTLTSSSIPKNGKSLGRKDKQKDIYGEDEANYIVIGFRPSPTSKAVRDILIYDIPAK